MKKASINEKGFTLIEAIASLAILAVLFISLYGLIIQTLKIVKNNNLKMGAIIIADQKMERIRNLPYVSIGTTAGIVNGVIPDTEVVNSNGIYSVSTLVLYVDDPFDGVQDGPTLSPPQADDAMPTDYKTVKVKVGWTGPFGYREISDFTEIVPKGIETSVGGGTLVVKVFNASGQPVNMADVRVINSSTTPAIDTGNSLKTNASGQVILYGAKPSVENYQIIVSKAGYSTSSSSPRTAGNPNPTIPNATVVLDDKTEIGFSIDLLSNLTIHAVKQDLPDNFIISNDASGQNQTNPNLTIDASGNLYAVWQDYRSASAAKIYAQKYDSSGNKLWGSDQVISPANNQVSPEVKVDGLGNLYISWNDDSNGNQDVYLVKRASSDGSDLWAGSKKVDTSADNKDQSNPRIALSPDNTQVAVVWQDNRNSDLDIYLQRYISNRTPVFSPEIRVNSNAINDGSNQYDPDVTTDPSANTYVTWTDERDGNQDIYAQQYNLVGSKVWANDVLVNSNSGTTNQYASTLAYGTSTIYVAWTDERNGNKDIYMQKLSSSGTKLWPTDVLINSDGGSTNQFAPSLAVSSTTIYIAWTDERNGNQDIFTQKLDTDGNKLWGADVRINVNLGASTQSNPSIYITPGSLKPYVVWQDDKNGNFDIYGSAVDQYGTASEIYNIPISIVGAKKIGENPIIYKFNQNYTFDTTAPLSLSNIEWDSYSISTSTGYTAHSIIMTSQSLPLNLNPNVNQDVTLYFN